MYSVCVDGSVIIVSPFLPGAGDPAVQVVSEEEPDDDEEDDELESLLGTYLNQR